MAHLHYYLDTTDINDVTKIKYKLLKTPKLLYTGYVSDDPMWFNIEHSHEFCEIIYILSGQGFIILDGNKHFIKTGDLIVINPNTIHEESSDKNNPLHFLFLAIDRFKVSGLENNMLIPADAYPIMTLTSYKFKVESYFLDIVKETANRVEYFETISHSLVCALIVLILRVYISSNNTFNNTTSECQKVQQYIDQNYQSEITLESLAKTIYISKHHLSHIFKSETGMSPIKYVITKRISEASRLLIETQDPIYEIANKVGYTDPVYFSQIFKKTVGISPQNFRNKYNPIIK